MPRLHQVGAPVLPAALGGREAAGQQHGARGVPPVQRRVPHRLSQTRSRGVRAGPGRPAHLQGRALRRRRHHGGLHLLDRRHLRRRHRHAGGGPQGGAGRDGARRPALPADRAAHHPRHADPGQDDPLGGLRPAPVEEVLQQAADPQQHLPRDRLPRPPHPGGVQPPGRPRLGHADPVRRAGLPHHRHHRGEADVQQRQLQPAEDHPGRHRLRGHQRGVQGVLQTAAVPEASPPQDPQLPRAGGGLKRLALGPQVSAGRGGRGGGEGRAHPNHRNTLIPRSSPRHAPPASGLAPHSQRPPDACRGSASLWRWRTSGTLAAGVQLHTLTHTLTHLPRTLCCGADGLQPQN